VAPTCLSGQDTTKKRTLHIAADVQLRQRGYGIPYGHQGFGLRMVVPWCAAVNRDKFWAGEDLYDAYRRRCVEGPEAVHSPANAQRFLHAAFTRPL